MLLESTPRRRPSRNSRAKSRRRAPTSWPRSRPGTWKRQGGQARKQIANCKLLAPGDGLVVYANDPNRFGGSTQPQIEEGATVRERQKIFSLPDITQDAGEHQGPRVDDRPDHARPARGSGWSRSPTSPHRAPSSTSPRCPTRRASSAPTSRSTPRTSTIDKGLAGLRPGMTAQVEILVTELENVLSVPVQAVLEYKGKDHVAVKTAGRLHVTRRRPRHLQRQARRSHEGIKAGDMVALNPIALMSEDEKREAFGVDGEGRRPRRNGAARQGQGRAAPRSRPPGRPDGKGASRCRRPRPRARAAGRRHAARRLLSRRFRTSLKTTAKMKTASPEEREAILKKAGFTDDEIDADEADASAAWRRRRWRLRRRRRRLGGGGGGGGAAPAAAAAGVRR